MPKSKVLASDSAAPPTTLELLWVDQWMESLPFVPSLMEGRTAFVRAEMRQAHVRRAASEWERRWQTFQTLVP